MNDISKTSCRECSKVYSVQMPMCPFCGAGREGFASEPLVETSNVSNRAEEPSSDFVTQELVAEVDASPQISNLASGTVCVSCSAIYDLMKIRIESWEKAGMTFRGAQKYSVTRVEAPCYCRSCMISIYKKRFMADILTVLPVVILAPLASIAGGHGNMSVVIIGLYCVYLLRWGGYTWADKIVYGISLEMELCDWVPSKEGKIKFPVEWGHKLLRIILLIFLPVLYMILREEF